MKNKKWVKYSYILLLIVVGGCGIYVFQYISLSKSLTNLLIEHGAYRKASNDLKVTNEEAIVELGKNLFFDKILSGNKNISCSSCHSVEHGTSDGLPVSMGEDAVITDGVKVKRAARLTARNSQSLLNFKYKNQHSFFWDGRVEVEPKMPGANSIKFINSPISELNGEHSIWPEVNNALTNSLSAQALFPLLDFSEMRGLSGSNDIAQAKTAEEAWQVVVNRIKDEKNGYNDLLKNSYPELEANQLKIGHIVSAIAIFIEKRFFTDNAPVDEMAKGEYSLVSLEALKGGNLFFTAAKCVRCHTGTEYEDGKFWAKASPQVGPGQRAYSSDQETVFRRGYTISTFDDFGRYQVTRNAKDMYKFKTPSLREISLTGPYFHNGVFENLSRAVEHCANPVESLKKLSLTEMKDEIRRMNFTQNQNDNNRRVEAYNNQEVGSVQLSKKEIEQITAFLYEMLSTSNTKSKLKDLVPSRVPSGLPIDP
jgi:cytochrome c peroxidase